MKLSEVKLEGIGIMPPGKRGMMQPPSKSGFKAKEGYDLDYDPETGLVTITKDDDSISLHAQRCLHMKQMAEAEVVQLKPESKIQVPQKRSKLQKVVRGRRSYDRCH